MDNFHFSFPEISIPITKSENYSVFYNRGVPGSPGRVVNLLPDSQESQVWGVAYHVEDSVWEAGVRDQLDYRENATLAESNTYRETCSTLCQ